MPADVLARLRDARLYLPNPTLRNPAWDAAAIRVLILRLSPFQDVERSGTHGWLAASVRAAEPGAFVDLAFLPRRDDAALLRDAGLPVLLGTQSHRGAADFDLVLVSNAWLLEQVNLPWLLAGSGIPPHARDRAGRWPPFILGGSNATAAHALLRGEGDAVADAFFFGEGEGVVGHLVSLYRSSAGSPVRERLALLAREVPGLWVVTDAGGTGARRHRAGMEALARHGAVPGPVLPGPEAGTVRLSISRGCPCLCSFCFEGYDRKPWRELPAALLLEQARELKRATGAGTVELDSFNFSTHREIGPLLAGLHRLFGTVSAMSQRVDVLARTRGLLDLELLAGKASYTLGIEGISARQRAFLHKSLETADIRSVLAALHERSVREIKLFFLLSGRETDADVAELVDLLKELKAIRSRAAHHPRMVFSFGRLVRMPFTPLRRDPPVLDEKTWKPLIGRVKSACETNGFEFRLALGGPEYDATQALALGGPGVHDLLLRLAAAGPVTDAPLTNEAQAAVREWLSARGAEAAVGFPFLDDRGTRAALARQYERAAAGEDVGYGRSPDRSPPDDAAIAAAARGLAPLAERKRRLRPLTVLLRVPREAAGMGREWTEAALMRGLFEREPGQVDNVLSIRDAWIEALGLLGTDLPWFGAGLFAVTAWDTASLARAAPAATPSRVTLRLTLPAASFPDPAGSLAAFLRDRHAPVTVARRDGALRFDVPEKSLKKRLLRGGACRSEEGLWVIDLDIGDHPFIGDWLQERHGPGAARAALAEVRGIE